MPCVFHRKGVVYPPEVGEGGRQDGEAHNGGHKVCDVVQGAGKGTEVIPPVPELGRKASLPLLHAPYPAVQAGGEAGNLPVGEKGGVRDVAAEALEPAVLLLQPPGDPLLQPGEELFRLPAQKVHIPHQLDADIINLNVNPFQDVRLPVPHSLSRMGKVPLNLLLGGLFFLGLGGFYRLFLFDLGGLLPEGGLWRLFWMGGKGFLLRWRYNSGGRLFWRRGLLWNGLRLRRRLLGRALLFGGALPWGGWLRRFCLLLQLLQHLGELGAAALCRHLGLRGVENLLPAALLRTGSRL